MGKDEITGKIKEFINKTDGFNCITMNGLYALPTDIFLMSIKHFLIYGENVLNEYHKIRSILMSISINEMNNDDSYLILKDINLLERAFKQETFWNIYSIFSKDDIKLFKKHLNQSRDHIKHINSYRQRRERASLYTNDYSVRKKVFNRDGKKCAKCGSTENLTLDHIKPVIRGGKNELDNLQVLCKSCNSKKGAKYQEK